MSTKSLIAIGVFTLILISGSGIFKTLNELSNIEMYKQNSDRLAKSNLDLSKKIKELEAQKFELKEQNKVLTNSLDKLTAPSILVPVKPNKG
jgi:prefoldin subunit 5